MSEITAEMIAAVLRYDPETGKLFWKERPASMFPSIGAANAWNARFAGVETMINVNQNGYLQGKVLGQTMKAHRVAWLLQTGMWPENHIDHINGQKTDNRFENLRDVPQAENNRNARARIDNTSGVPGVFFHRNTGKWTAQTYENGKRVHLGLFETKEAAAAAKTAKQTELGFHPNHGRAA